MNKNEEMKMKQLIEENGALKKEYEKLKNDNVRLNLVFDWLKKELLSN